MDFDVSTQSVRTAISDLQLKVHHLEDERDHFHHLNLTTAKAFEDHRRELNMLLQKERSVASASEEKLRLELQRVLALNTLLQSRAVEHKSEASQKVREAIDSFRSEQERREASLRDEVSACRSELFSCRQRSTQLREERRTVELSMNALLQQQSALQSEMETLQHQRHTLEEAVALDQMASDRRRRSPSRPCQQSTVYDDMDGGSGRLHRNKVQKVFLPSGKAEVVPLSGKRRPASHHLHAVVQTLEHQSLLQPRPFDGTRSGKQLDSVCRGILAELLSMKREYATLTDRLGDPTVDSLEISRRLRMLMYDMDRKTEQLRRLRQQQLRIDDDVRIHEMMKDILSEQSTYEDLHEELVKILRCSSSSRA